MNSPLLFVRALLAVAAVFACVLHAQSAGAAERIPLDSMAAFRPIASNWKIAGGIGGDPRRDKALTPVSGTGVLVCNPGKDRESRGHLFTTWEHGDLELDLEFLLTPGANSGLYLQGRYELQLFDSWGKAEVSPGDCGGIYQRWDPARGKGREGYDGHAPRANACRPPGDWQTLHIAFQAPRFDASGRKIRNARFMKVVLNGVTIHENVAVTGPTRSPAFADEKPAGPLMIQGNHGPVALRNIVVKRLAAGAAGATEER